ncbi:MAG: hypothetical protein SF053_21435 [Bacteroidia bacterium]|nr:hypothetical protein [Bacteroidia bacterium]
MKPEQTVLTFAGLLGIVAFFLPFIKVEIPILNTTVFQYSGFSVTEDIVEIVQQQQVSDTLVLGKENNLVSTLITLWQNTDSVKDKGALAGIMFLVVGPLLYALFAVWYVLRGVFGRQFKFGIGFNVLFLALGWAIFYGITQGYLGNIFGKMGETSLDLGIGLNLDLAPKVDLSLNFFKLAGIGFWLAFASIWIAGFSLLFEKSSDNAAAAPRRRK